MRGFQFQAIDLRWGIPGEAGRDHRTMQICFDELRRAQEVSPRPNFLVLLGDRYGWQPLPELLTNEEFTKLEAAATRVDQREPERELNAAGALRTWYRRDDNADPVEYVLRSRYDWPDRGVWEDEDAEQRAWEVVEQALWDVINEEYRLESLEGRFASAGQAGSLQPAIVKFQGSATEQEIWRGAFAVPDAPNHVVAWYRTIRNRERWQRDPRATDFFDTNEALLGPANELRGELKQRLHRDGKKDVEPVEVALQPSADGEKLEVKRDHLQPMCDEIEVRLREIIDEEIRTYWSPQGASSATASSDQSVPSEERKLELEVQAHRLFGESRAPKEGFVGRDQELKAIDDYLSDANDRNPLVVHGPSGTGKTALLARAANIAAEDHKDRVFLRFLGTTPQSSNLNALLTSLCRELRPSEDRANDLPVELRLLQDEFDRLLALATAEKPILLFLDALDQLDEADGARQAYWLRTPLPPHVKVVVSCIRDEEGPAELNEAYRCFERRKLLHRAIAIESLTASEAILAIDLWLQNDHRRPGHWRKLTTGQRDAIAARITSDSAASCRRPLYLRILFEECRLWPSWKAVPASELGENTAALLDGLFERLAQPAMHGPLLVESVLSYIASARRGLSENEILELLWADPDYKQYLDVTSRKTKHELPSEASRIPIAIWSRLRHDLEPYLAEQSAPGGVVLSFYHRVVGRVAAESFLNDSARRCLRHSRLAGYFQSERQPWWRDSDPSRQRTEDTAAQGVPNARRATELPWQLLREAEELDPEHERPAVWEAPVILLCDLEFVEVKCAAGLVFELQEDYRNAIAILPEAQAGLCQERERQARLNRWTEEITEYSHQWSERRDRLAEGKAVTEREPAMPEPPPSVISREARQNKRPDRCSVDRIEGWSRFVSNRTAILAARELPVFPIAWNYADAGPVAEETELLRRSGRGYEGPWLRLLKRPVYVPQPPLLKTMHGHRGSVRAVALNANGDIALSAGVDSYVRVWNVPAGLCVKSLAGHKDEVLAAAMTPDGNWAISGGKDQSALFWNLIAGDCAQTFTGHTGPVTAVALTADGRFGLTTDRREIRMWDCQHGNAIHVLKPDADYPGYLPDITALAISPDGRFAASASDLGNVRLWDLLTARCVSANGQRYFSVDELCSIRCVCFRTIPNDIIATVPSKGIYFMSMDATSGYQAPIKEDAYSAQTCTLTADGTNLLVGRGDHAVSVWDLRTQECVLTLRGHTDSVSGVAVSADGEYAVSGSIDGTVRVWGLRDVCCPTAGLEQYGTLENIGINEDGKNAVSVDLGGRIHRWDTATGELIASRQISSDPITAVAFAENSPHALLSILEPPVPWDETSIYDLERNSLVFANLKSGASLLRSSRHRSYDAMALCDGGHSAVLMESDRLILWDIERDERIRLFEDPKVGRFTSFAVSSDCHLLISGGGIFVFGGGDHCVRVWNLVKGGLLAVMTGHTDTVLATTVTSDGRFVLSGSVDRTIRVWSLRTKQCVLVLGPHSSAVISMAVSPDAQNVAAGCEDGSIYLWDLASGDMQLKGFSHKGAVRRITTVQNRLVIGAIPSSLEFYEIENALLNRKPTFITATRRWAFRDDSKNGEWDKDYTAVCELCGARFVVNQAIVETIKDVTQVSEVPGEESPCLALPNDAWDNRRLLSICPHCHNAIRFNPFLDDGRER
jgi:WD40 repeat protein